jgi:hypothetical protein
VRDAARETAAIEVKPVPETLLDDLDPVLARHPRRGRDAFDLALSRTDAQPRHPHDLHLQCP